MQGEVPLSNDGAQKWVTRKLCALSTLASVGVAEEPPGTLTDLRGRKGQSERLKSLFRVRLSLWPRAAARRSLSRAAPCAIRPCLSRSPERVCAQAGWQRGGSGVAAGSLLCHTDCGCYGDNQYHS